ncbi:hypothetical protein [Neomegalonema perideroedes]|uniref:hypothetical protein n=1 Tax=Neomegalonema perideroedes TaxID=217219 RepID=UPI00036C510B|nr:hypothetical protein [Neomegalonema perideroedes]
MSSSVREIRDGLFGGGAGRSDGGGAGRSDRDLERAFGRAERQASGRARSWSDQTESRSEGRQYAAMRGWGEDSHPSVVDGFTSTLRRPERPSEHARP